MNMKPGLIEFVTFHSFVDGFHRMNREDNFSYAALKELYNYYIELSHDIGDSVEFDVISICGEWSEMDLLEVFRSFPSILDQLDVDEVFNYLQEDEKKEFLEEEGLEEDDLDSSHVEVIVEWYMDKDEVNNFLHEQLHDYLIDSSCIHVEAEDSWLIPDHSGLFS